jgi:hypothetical protein
MMSLFDVISIALVMVLECFVCDERSGLCRVYVKSGQMCRNKNPKSGDKQQQKIRVRIFEGLSAFSDEESVCVPQNLIPLES